MIEKRATRNGFALPLVIAAVVILAALAVGLMMASYGVRIQAVRAKCQTEALLAAEAGYERGIFWMSQQTDILGALGAFGASGTIDFGTSDCTYEVGFDDYIGARPVFRITSTGNSGASTRVVDVAVMQAITGWVMGKCRVPASPTSTYPVNFADGEIIDVPVHINNHKDSPDERDIYISGDPAFMQKVEMGESRRTLSGADKYATVMDLFNQGIYFDQPDVRITDEAAVQSKVNRFRDSTNSDYRFTPLGTANISRPHSAVQIEFFVEDDQGKVRITSDCTIRGYERGGSSSTTWDYEIVPGSGGNTYQKYDTYAYHYTPDIGAPVVVAVVDTYVTQEFGGKQSAPGGQIFIDGDVILGSEQFDEMVLKGKMTIVATGNIWIADSVVVDGARDASTGMPAPDNQNVLGLIAQGIVKVIDPGMSRYSNSYPNLYPGPPEPNCPDKLYPSSRTHSYEPVGNGAGYYRNLPHTTVIEAAIAVGGGGWGAENVRRGSYGGRLEEGPGQDLLILRGSISESVRGVVGLVGSDGYIKRYYLDRRLLEGILPGDIWFGGKYVPAPAGWHDYRPTE